MSQSHIFKETNILLNTNIQYKNKYQSHKNFIIDVYINIFLKKKTTIAQYSMLP